jgi:hypothetical protein
MNKEFVNYEIAFALKELGFDEPCYRFYYGDRLGLALNLEQGDTNTKLQKLHPNYVAVPLKQQVFRWFRDKHEWYANLSSWLHEEEIGTYHEFEIYGANQYAHGSVPFKTYEEAENACIDKLIEIAKQQDND